MPHCDSAFYIGKSHDICEDYVTKFSALNKNQIVLCDGCSSSDMVDVGARLLSLAFTSLLDTIECDVNDSVIKTFARTFYYDNYNRFIHNHQTMFDATLLFIQECSPSMIQIGVIGDGVVAYKTKSGQLIINDYQCGNMPRYLSYSWDDKRRALYDACKQPYYYDHYIDGVATANALESFYHHTLLEKEGIEWIAIFSDGVHSFRDDKNRPIDFQQIVSMLTGFKTFSGQFAQRRMNGFRKECAKAGWTHDDDISIGCIYLGD